MGASSNPNATRLSALNERKKALEDTLQKNNLELRQLCIKEAELTGVIPIEYPLEPGERPPVFQKTKYQISENLLNNLNGDESVSEMELELQLLANMADAAQGFANDQNIGKTARRHHRSEYDTIKKRYEALLEKIQFSQDSYSVATRQTASTSNKGANTQLKQKKKPRPSGGEHESSASKATVPLAITTDSTSASSSSFSKESPHRRSSRSLASDKAIRDSVPNLVSTPLQRAGSTDANVGGGEHLLRVSRSHTAMDDAAGGFVSPGHHEPGYNSYGDDLNRRFAQMNAGNQPNGARRAPYAHTMHTPQRMVYEDNQRQLDSLLYRQQAQVAHAQTLERRHEHSSAAHAMRSEHHSMYNINSSFPRQQMYDDPTLQRQHVQQQSQLHNANAVRPHSVLVYRQHQPVQQLQPHQLYGDAQQQQQHQQQQQQQPKMHWRVDTESPPQQPQPQQQHHQLDVSSSSALALDHSSTQSIATTPLRYGSLDRRRERPQRTLQANTQTQNHDVVQRRKKSVQNKGTNRLATASSNKTIDQQQPLHQQLQRTQSLGSVGIIQQQQQQLINQNFDEIPAEDINLENDMEFDNITTVDEDNQSSCGSEQSMKYQQLRRRTRSKEKNWYESSLDVQQDNSDRSSNMTHSSTHSVIAPEEKYGDVSIQFRQRAATISAANTTMALNSLSTSMVSPPAIVRPLSTVAPQFNFRQGQERQTVVDRMINHRSPSKQIQQPQQQQQQQQQQHIQHHQQQPPIRPRAQHFQAPLPPPPIQQQLLEIPAESRPSPSIADRMQNHSMYQEYTSPIPKAGTTVLQVGHCKPYQEETKPFEMSDYYKYSTKHNKASPAKLQPPTHSPSISTIVTLSPHPEFQHSSPNNMSNYAPSSNVIGQPMMAAQRTIHFSPSSPSKGSSPRIVPNSPRRSMNSSFDMAATHNIAENFTTEMNQWYHNNNSNNNVNNNMIVPEAGAGMNGNSPRKGNATTTATLV